MPTSKGLSYSTNSLPRKACTVISSACDLDQLLMSSGAASSGENRRFLRVIQNSCQFRDFVIGRTHSWLGLRKMQTRPLFDGISQGDITRNDHDGNAAP